MKQGESKRVNIGIKNNDAKKIEVSLKQSGLNDIIRIRNPEISLESGETKIVAIDLIALEELAPGNYLGKIIATFSGKEKEILLSVDISSKKALFDVSVRIHDQYQNVARGSSLFAEIELINLGEKRADAELEYLIKNKAGEIIVRETETVAVETKADLIKEFKIPENAKPGDYILQITSAHNGEKATASAWFKVIKSPAKINTILIIAVIATLVLMVAVIIVILLIAHANNKRLLRNIEHRINEFDLIPDRSKKRKK